MKIQSDQPKIQYFFPLSVGILYPESENTGRVFEGEKKLSCHLKDSETNIKVLGLLEMDLGKPIFCVLRH